MVSRHSLYVRTTLDELWNDVKMLKRRLNNSVFWTPSVELVQRSPGKYNRFFCNIWQITSIYRHPKTLYGREYRCFLILFSGPPCISYWERITWASVHNCFLLLFFYHWKVFLSVCSCVKVDIWVFFYAHINLSLWGEVQKMFIIEMKFQLTAGTLLRRRFYVSLKMFREYSLVCLRKDLSSF